MNRFVFLVLNFYVIQLYLNVPLYAGQAGLEVLLPFLNYTFLALVFVYLLLNLKRLRLPVPFLGLYLILFLFSLWSEALLGDEELFVTVIGNYSKVLILLLGTVLFFGISAVNRYKVMPIFVISALLASFFNVIDFFFQDQFFQIMDGFGVRAAGFYINPNNAAAAILLAMAVSTASLPNRYRIWFISACLIGVALTLSRGGMLVWFALYIFFLFNKTIDTKTGIVFTGTLVFLLTALGVVFEYLSDVVDLGQYADRVSFLEGKDVGQSVESDSRFGLITRSLDLFSSSPLYGNGTNALLRSGSDQLSHNQYLAMLVDYGVIGLFVYLVMVYEVFKSKREFWAACLCVLLWGMFAHDILQQYVFVITFAYVSLYRKEDRPLLTI